MEVHTSIRALLKRVEPNDMGLGQSTHRKSPVYAVGGGSLTPEQLILIEQKKAAALERKRGLPHSGFTSTSLADVCQSVARWVTCCACFRVCNTM